MLHQQKLGASLCSCASARQVVPPRRFALVAPGLTGGARAFQATQPVDELLDLLRAATVRWGPRAQASAQAELLSTARDVVAFSGRS